MISRPCRPASSSVVRLRLVLLVMGVAWLASVPLSASAQDDPQPLEGAQALAHPAVQLAIRAAELVKAGKVEEAIALRTTSARAEWKNLSADDRREFAAAIASRTPDPKALADGVRSGGTLNLMGTRAVLNVQTPKSQMLAYFEREGDAWRMMNGPLEVAAEPDPATQTRLEGEAVASHPVWALALEYLDLVHAGKIDAAKQLATAEVQARWQKEPASEKAASLAFLRKNLPTRAAVTAALKGDDEARCVLLIDDDTRATLNVIRSERREEGPGRFSVSSTTSAIGFAKDGGQWRLAQ